MVLAVTHWALYRRRLLGFDVKDFIERDSVRAEIVKCGCCNSYGKIKAALAFVATVDTQPLHITGNARIDFVKFLWIHV
jgi:hypothetical protein